MNASKTLLVLMLLLSLAPATARANKHFLWGDRDGFGLGATTFKDPLVDSAGIGEAAGTDIRLIGTGFAAPAFEPTATLLFGPESGITDITVTMAMAEFGGNANSVDGPNSIVLDGATVSSAFLDSFTSFPNSANPNVETQSFSLPSSFFPLFADGAVDLTGTRISESSGFASFQIDYIQFDITAVPEPSTLSVLVLSLAAVAAMRRRKPA